jgi:hypothetical protein
MLKKTNAITIKVERVDSSRLPEILRVFNE